MSRSELAVLRTQMYAAHAVYITALHAYTAVRREGPPARVAHAVPPCHTAGRAYEATLIALIQYLESIQPGRPPLRELERARKLQQSVRRELALVT